MPRLLIPLSPHTPDQDHEENDYFICSDYSPSDFPLDLNRARLETEDEINEHSRKDDEGIMLSQSCKKSQSMLFNFTPDDELSFRKIASAPSLKLDAYSDHSKSSSHRKQGCLALLKPLKEVAIFQRGLKNWVDEITSRWMQPR